MVGGVSVYRMICGFVDIHPVVMGPRFLTRPTVGCFFQLPNCRPCHQGPWRWKCGRCANSPHEGEGQSFGERMGFADFHCHCERRHFYLNQHTELPQVLKITCTLVSYWNVPRILELVIM